VAGKRSVPKPSARKQSKRVDESKKPGPLDDIADLIGSVDGLPTDLSARKKHYLRVTGYGRHRGG
jgi:hypothetical protein